MANSLIDRLKKSVISGAQTSAVRLEEAARQGKWHLEIMAEKRKLNREFAELGKEAYMALLEGDTSQLAGRPGIEEIRENIERYKRNVAEIEERIAEARERNMGLDIQEPAAGASYEMSPSEKGEASKG